METGYIIKEFFSKTIKSKFLDCRNGEYYINNNNRENYIFNSNINGIDESDLIILIGTNPRYEATILNLRIRQSYLKNKTEIYSLGDIGEQTYPYSILQNSSDEIKNILENENSEIAGKIKKSLKPIIIIGQSVLKLKSGKYIFENIKDYLIKNNKINDQWKALNILSNNAATVGSYDLDLLSGNGNQNPTLTKIKENNFEIVFLFGQDDLNFNKKDEFVIYIGSHGDRGAELANIILPGASFTEQEGHFTNLEGKIQKAYRASYPPGQAKEDWEIVNNLSKLIKRKKLFNNKNELIDAMFNYLKLNKKEDNTIDSDCAFISEKIHVDQIDYYFSNVVSRASKTMAECRSEKIKTKRTGTEG